MANSDTKLEETAVFIDTEKDFEIDDDEESVRDK